MALWFRKRKTSNPNYNVPYTNAPSGREIGTKTDACVADNFSEPNFDEILKNIDIPEGCPPVSCWNVNYARVGDLSLDEISNGKVKEIKQFLNSEKTRMYWGDGTAILDRLMEFASENLRIQKDNGHLSNGSDYKDAYVATMQTVIQTGVQLLIQSKDLTLRAAEAQLKAEAFAFEKVKSKYDIQNSRLALEIAKEQVRKSIYEKSLLLDQKRLLKMQVENMREQSRLYERQRLGFNDNMFIKLLEAQLNSYAMIYSSGMVDSDILPDPINPQELKDVYTKFKYRTQECDSDGNPLPIVEEYSVDRRIVEPESKFCL